MLPFIDYVLALAGILLLASMSGFLSERAGVVNIGIEGMMTIGALIVAMIGATANGTVLMQIIGVITAAIVGGVFALLHGYASITLKANQIISGTAINIFAGGIGLFFATSGFFGPNSTDITTNFQPIYIDPTQVIPLWFLIALIITLGIWIFIKFTKFGMRYSMIGENPNAVDAAGINVNKYRYLAVFLSGLMAGFAGAVLVVTVIGGGVFGGTTFGFGFLALAIMIFGQWKIEFISLGVIIFATLFGLGNQIGSLINSDTIRTHAGIFKIIPFVLTIIVMIIFSRWSHAPAADGKPFDKSLR